MKRFHLHVGVSLARRSGVAKNLLKMTPPAAADNTHDQATQLS